MIGRALASPPDDDYGQQTWLDSLDDASLGALVRDNLDGALNDALLAATTKTYADACEAQRELIGEP